MAGRGLLADALGSGDAKSCGSHVLFVKLIGICGMGNRIPLKSIDNLNALCQQASLTLFFPLCILVVHFMT